MTFLVGIAACGVASLFFGSMFVALRRIETGDGIFAQWVISMAILCVGFADFWYRGFPGFYPLAMLGGAFWTVGNTTAIPLIKRIGLALGILLWGSSKCVVGWATGRFGMFGMKPNPPSSSTLNYVGVLFVILGIRAGKSEKEKERSSEDSEGSPKASNDSSDSVSTAREVSERSSKISKKQEVPISRTEKLICIGVAIMAGVFYGLNFVPVIYMIDNPDRFPGYPTDGLSYVFSHFFGIFLTATAIFLIYTVFRKGEAFMASEVVLPAFLAGLLWAAAQTAFFIANQHLSQAISFPIITGLPGCVASLWSVLYFREIRGTKNLLFFAAALLLTVIGAVLVGLSKKVQL
ncbi:Transmembrane protein [Trichostrongylus colubriformis]|uniref:Transmembrane protein n=1 Tax=Trichostrongylus colubriformis TaxID=6319 RepID=A0AAN8J1C0_TRICO